MSRNAGGNEIVVFDEAQTADTDREMVSLKEENARILSELFHKKEEVGNLQAIIRDLESAQAELHAEIDSIQDTLAEKEQFYVQRDIKSNATLAQHKKLIDYLQVLLIDFFIYNLKILIHNICS